MSGGEMDGGEEVDGAEGKILLEVQLCLQPKVSRKASGASDDRWYMSPRPVLQWKGAAAVKRGGVYGVLSTI